MRHDGRAGVPPDGLVLDMRGFNRIVLDAVATVTVRRRDLARHPERAPSALRGQGDAVDRHFTVGGSISVNAHGMDHQAGAVAKSIRSMRVMLADGSLRRCRRPRTGLFRHVVGGYGLFGVMVEAELEIADNWSTAPGGG